MPHISGGSNSQRLYTRGSSLPQHFYTQGGSLPHLPCQRACPVHLLRILAEVIIPRLRPSRP
jgi:hypothetical protein